MLDLAPIIALVGPTASGKTAAGVALARRFGGEIINCDSVQVYQDIEIATAKPSEEERQGVPHHLLDFVPPTARYTAAQWATDAARVIADIESRGRLPIIVGGTGFYLRALVQPFSDLAPTDDELRRRLDARRLRRGNSTVHNLLRRLDPPTAERIPERNWARAQRALEVRILTGRRLSELTAADPSTTSEYAGRVLTLVLSPDREQLYERIDRRTLKHFENGLLEEVQRLLTRGIPRETSALGAHGYRRVVEYLHGERDLGSAIELTQQNVRNYAKRQLSWIRRDPEAIWFEGFGDEVVTQERLAEVVATRLAER